MPIEIRELQIKVVVKEDAAATATGGTATVGMEYGSTGTAEADPPGTGKMLTAALLGRTGVAEAGTKLVADASLIEADTFSWGTAPSGEDSSASARGASDEATFRGGITVAVGDVGSGDDVVVDGRIITGEMPGFGDGSVRPMADAVDLL